MKSEMLPKELFSCDYLTASVTAATSAVFFFSFIVDAPELNVEINTLIRGLICLFATWRLV